MSMDFSTNKTPVEIIKQGVFGGTYFRDIYSEVNGQWYRKHMERKCWSKLLLLKFYTLGLWIS